MVSKRSPSRATDDQETDRLLEVVDQLQQQAGVLIDLISDVREDLSWLTRNGVPHQPLLIRVERMALDPLAKDWGDRLQISVISPNQRRFPDLTGDDSSGRVTGLVERLADPLGQVAPQQLAVLTSLIDRFKHEILQAIHSRPITLP